MQKDNSIAYKIAFLAVALSVVVSCGGPRRSKLLPLLFVIELNAINPGQYDPASDKWVQGPLNGHSEVSFKYTIINKIKTIPGKVTAKLGNITLLSSATFPNTVPEIDPGVNFSSEFHSYALPPGTYPLTITYSTPGTTFGIPLPGGGFRYQDSTIAEQSFTYFVPPDLVDEDQDGIDDREEKRLLDKYAPYYYFSRDGDNEEDFRPTDIMDYIRGSRLITSTEEISAPIVIDNFLLATNPHNLLFAIPTSVHPTPSSLLTHAAPVPTSFYIDPSDEAGKGNSWDECQAKRNVGLYGHVVPYRQSSPQKDVHDLYMPDGNFYYKIEYWQFFGYNRTSFQRIADHEGDWTCVELLYHPLDSTIATVFHYCHGDEFRFDMSAKTSETISGVVKEFKGANARFNPDISVAKLGANADILKSDDYDQTQNNIVRFMQDPISMQFTHPIVYIEYEDHEYFPTQYWKFLGAANHDGTSIHKYFCAAPPNLGEVEHPLQEYEGADIVLQFNGYWGARSSTKNYPGPGPSLHQQWTWPASSSIGWQLHNLPY